MKKQEKLDKAKLEEEIQELNVEINEKHKETYSSSKGKSIRDKKDNLWKEKGEKNKELRKLRRAISEKYLNKYSSYRYLDIKQIKSSVKQGIKRGLNTKHINLIYEYDMAKIVEQLIKEDLEKTNEKEILSDMLKFDEKIIKIDEDEKILFSEIDTLREKRREVENKLYREKAYRDKIKVNKQKEVGKVIEKDLPNLIGKIRKEVERGLLLDNLN